jgi:hypothetical protein
MLSAILAPNHDRQVLLNIVVMKYAEDFWFYEIRQEKQIF